MTRDDIIHMAKESGLIKDSIIIDYAEVSDLEIFAGMVAAAEREACAKICDAEANSWNEPFGYALADAIRARGQ